MIAIVVFAAVLERDRRRGSPEGFEQRKYTGIDYERLYAVTTAFRRVLERPPTEAELQEYESKLSLDPEFDVPALETHLRQSAEYKRLTGMQKNSTLSEVGGVVSEAAIRGKLAGMYEQIVGHPADDVTMDLLYSRYRHTNLSDAYITALIQQMAVDPSEPVATNDHGGDSASTVTTSGAPAGTGSDDASSGVDGFGPDTVDANAGTDSSDDTVNVERRYLAALGLSEADLQGEPSQVSKRLESLAKSCRTSQAMLDERDQQSICRRERRRMLDSIGYEEGQPIGSWTMPRDLQERTLIAARRDHAAVRTTTAPTDLGATPIADGDSADADVALALFPSAPGVAHT